MDKNKEYIKSYEDLLKNYKDLLSNIESALKDTDGSKKKQLLAKNKQLKDKYKEAENNFKKLKSATEEGIENVKDSSLEGLNVLKDVLAEYAEIIGSDNIKEKVAQAKDQAIQFGMNKEYELEEHVRKNPLATIAVAVGAGLLLGLYLRRSH